MTCNAFVGIQSNPTMQRNILCQLVFALVVSRSVFSLFCVLFCTKEFIIVSSAVFPFYSGDVIVSQKVQMKMSLALQLGSGLFH